MRLIILFSVRIVTTRLSPSTSKLLFIALFISCLAISENITWLLVCYKNRLTSAFFGSFRIFEPQILDIVVLWNPELALLIKQGNFSTFIGVKVNARHTGL